MLSKTLRVTTQLSRHARAVTTEAKSRVTAVLGSQWGDEGKGKLADVLAKDYDVVCRFNGGANAGHTVIAGGKKFAFHLLPCGLIYPHTTNLLGNGVVVHLESMFEELAPVHAAGISTEGRLLLSDRAHLLFDFHKLVDGMLEGRLSKDGSSIGTTKKGIGPAYASKMTRNGIRVGHLRHMESFNKRLRRTIEEHQMMYDFEYDIQAEIDKYEDLAIKVQPMIVDGIHFVNDAYNNGKRIITEGANAAMLDIDYGTYPYVTSSSTTAGGIATGLGLSPDKIDCVLGVVKAYTTRVGGGPFPTELTDERGGGDRPLNAEGTDIGLHLQTVGAEIGVTTGRKRRCGWLDAVVLRYSHMINNYAGLNITKLDILDELDEVKIGVAYKLHGEELPKGAMPSSLEDLGAVEVVYETMPGWKTSIADARTFEELPSQAQAYIKRIEELVQCPVTYIGVGPGREAMIVKE